MTNDPTHDDFTDAPETPTDPDGEVAADPLTGSTGAVGRRRELREQRQRSRAAEQAERDAVEAEAIEAGGGELWDIERESAPVGRHINMDVPASQTSAGRRIAEQIAAAAQRQREHAEQMRQRLQERSQALREERESAAKELSARIAASLEAAQESVARHEAAAAEMAAGAAVDRVPRPTESDDDPSPGLPDRDVDAQDGDLGGASQSAQAGSQAAPEMDPTLGWVPPPRTGKHHGPSESDASSVPAFPTADELVQRRAFGSDTAHHDPVEPKLIRHDDATAEIDADADAAAGDDAVTLDAGQAAPDATTTTDGVAAETDADVAAPTGSAASATPAEVGLAGGADQDDVAELADDHGLPSAPIGVSDGTDAAARDRTATRPLWELEDQHPPVELPQNPLIDKSNTGSLPSPTDLPHTFGQPLDDGVDVYDMFPGLAGKAAEEDANAALADSVAEQSEAVAEPLVEDDGQAATGVAAQHGAAADETQPPATPVDPPAAAAPERTLRRNRNGRGIGDPLLNDPRLTDPLFDDSTIAEDDDPTAPVSQMLATAPEADESTASAAEGDTPNQTTSDSGDTTRDVAAGDDVTGAAGATSELPSTSAQAPDGDASTSPASTNPASASTAQPESATDAAADPSNGTTASGETDCNGQVTAAASAAASDAGSGSADVIADHHPDSPVVDPHTAETSEINPELSASPHPAPATPAGRGSADEDGYRAGCTEDDQAGRPGSRRRLASDLPIGDDQLIDNDPAATVAEPSDTSTSAPDVADVAEADTSMLPAADAPDLSVEDTVSKRIVASDGGPDSPPDLDPEHARALDDTEARLRPPRDAAVPPRSRHAGTWMGFIAGLAGERDVKNRRARRRAVWNDRANASDDGTSDSVTPEAGTSDASPADDRSAGGNRPGLGVTDSDSPDAVPEAKHDVSEASSAAGAAQQAAGAAAHDATDDDAAVVEAPEDGPDTSAVETAQRHSDARAVHRNLAAWTAGSLADPTTAEASPEDVPAADSDLDESSATAGSGTVAAVGTEGPSAYSADSERGDQPPADRAADQPEAVDPEQESASTGTVDRPDVEQRGAGQQGDRKQGIGQHGGAPEAVLSEADQATNPAPAPDIAPVLDGPETTAGAAAETDSGSEAAPSDAFQSRAASARWWSALDELLPEDEAGSATADHVVDAAPDDTGDAVGDSAALGVDADQSLSQRIPSIAEENAIAAGEELPQAPVAVPKPAQPDVAEPSAQAAAEPIIRPDLPPSEDWHTREMAVVPPPTADSTAEDSPVAARAVPHVSAREAAVDDDVCIVWRSMHKTLDQPSLRILMLGPLSPLAVGFEASWIAEIQPGWPWAAEANAALVALTPVDADSDVNVIPPVVAPPVAETGETPVVVEAPVVAESVPDDPAPGDMADTEPRLAKAPLVRPVVETITGATERIDPVPVVDPEVGEPPGGRSRWLGSAAFDHGDLTEPVDEVTSVSAAADEATPPGHVPAEQDASEQEPTEPDSSDQAAAELASAELEAAETAEAEPDSAESVSDVPDLLDVDSGAQEPVLPESVSQEPVGWPEPSKPASGLSQADPATAGQSTVGYDIGNAPDVEEIDAAADLDAVDDLNLDADGATAIEPDTVATSDLPVQEDASTEEPAADASSPEEVSTGANLIAGSDDHDGFAAPYMADSAAAAAAAAAAKPGDFTGAEPTPESSDDSAEADGGIAAVSESPVDPANSALLHGDATDEVPTAPPGAVTGQVPLIPPAGPITGQVFDPFSQTLDSPMAGDTGEQPVVEPEPDGTGPTSTSDSASDVADAVPGFLGKDADLADSDGLVDRAVPVTEPAAAEDAVAEPAAEPTDAGDSTDEQSPRTPGGGTTVVDGDAPTGSAIHGSDDADKSAPDDARTGATGAGRARGTAAGFAAGDLTAGDLTADPVGDMADGEAAPRFAAEHLDGLTEPVSAPTDSTSPAGAEPANADPAEAGSTGTDPGADAADADDDAQPADAAERETTPDARPDDVADDAETPDATVVDEPEITEVIPGASDFIGLADDAAEGDAVIIEPEIVSDTADYAPERDTAEDAEPADADAGQADGDEVATVVDADETFTERMLEQGAQLRERGVLFVDRVIVVVKRGMAYGAGKPWVWFVAIGIGLVIVLILMVAAVRSLQPDGAADSPPEAVQAEPTETTALVIVSEETPHRVVAAAMLGVAPSSGTVMVVPVSVKAPLPGAPSAALRDASLVSEDAATFALEQTLQVSVDHTATMTSADFVALVDAVGGVPVRVTRAFQSQGELIPVGNYPSLSGAKAWSYVTSAAAGESTDEEAAKWAQVLVEVLRRMTHQGEPNQAMDSAVSGVPGSAKSVMQQVGSNIMAGTFGAAVLPTSSIDAGGEKPTVVVDTEKAVPMLQRRFGQAFTPQQEGLTRVLLQNGYGTPGLSQQAWEAMRDVPNMRMISGGNAAVLSQSETRIFVPEDTPQWRETAFAIAEALEVPSEAVMVSPKSSTLVDIIVVLGADFGDASAIAATPGGEAAPEAQDAAQNGTAQGTATQSATTEATATSTVTNTATNTASSTPTSTRSTTSQSTAGTGSDASATPSADGPTPGSWTTNNPLIADD